MPYKYYSIYNVSTGEYATNLSSQNDVYSICANNNWIIGSAIVGFYKKNQYKTKYNIIYCPKNHVVYVHLPDSYHNYNTYTKDNQTINIPPAVLINLNNNRDTYFFYKTNTY